MTRHIDVLTLADMAVMPPTVASTSTLAMLRAAESRGFETHDLLAAAGLERETVEDPDARLPGPSVLALWDALRERTADPVLQLTAPTILPFGAYRVIDYLVDASVTVGEGISRFARYFRLIAGGMALTIEEDDDERRLHLARADGGAVPPVYVDYVFAALVGRIRMQIRPGLRVKRVELRHGAPPEAARYEACFRAPVRFGVAGNRLCFGVPEWDSPMEHGDAALARLLEEHARMLEARLPEVSDSFVAEVREAFTAALPEGGKVARVARALHVSERTLQRKLVKAGTTFRDVADAARRGLAEAYLSDRHVSIAEVAFLLGFSDQTSFNRAFRRWTGASPGLWRRRIRGRPSIPGSTTRS
ncbi:MAG: AraC family transcriptional regulator [Gemmatimonadota bacterium]